MFITQVNQFEMIRIPIKLMIRAQLMVVANEPKMALEDIKEVLKDEPEDFLAICTKVFTYLFFSP